MAHYAILDENNVVTAVITGIDETELIDGKDTETWYSDFIGKKVKRTSYYSRGNKHFKEIDDGKYVEDGLPAFRKNYAGINFVYDEILDAFIPPKISDSAILDTETGLWIEVSNG